MSCESKVIITRLNDATIVNPSGRASQITAGPMICQPGLASGRWMWHDESMTFPSHQYARIADFFQDLAQVSVASIVVRYVLDDPPSHHGNMGSSPSPLLLDSQLIF